MSHPSGRRKRDPAEITDALRGIGDDYVRRNPADLRSFRRSMDSARRKRRVLFAGSLVTTTAIIAVLFVLMARSGNEKGMNVAEQPPPPDTLRITQQVALDGRPYQVASNSQGAYVTLRDEGAVLKIGGDSGTVEWRKTLGGTPEDIIAGEFAVWITEPQARQIHALSFGKGVATQQPIQVTKGIPQRLSVGRTSVRITTKGGPAYRIDFADRAGKQLGSDIAWDIAYLDDDVWLLTPEGLVYPVDAETGVPSEEMEPVQIFEAGQFDQASAGEITAAHGAIWYGRPGDPSLTRIDGDGSVQQIPLPDGYLDLDGDSRGGLWILTRSGEAGELIELDDETGEQLARSLILGNEPIDIAASGDGIWVVLAASREVLHVNDAAGGNL